ncbi:MAG: Do family serine endopeptidase [Thiocapsa sp.]|nr:Do family serine endopeptidase [Thiocapsa sp.]MCG6897650.1 Do family serine endopeptidase [Thiocapsa sp.]
MTKPHSPSPNRSFTVGTPAPTQRLGLATAVLALALSAGSLCWAGAGAMASDAGGADIPSVATPGLPSFADVAERVTPAVVNVSVKAEGIQPMQWSAHPPRPHDVPMPESFRRFFEHPGHEGPRRTVSQGSGFVLDAEGHIVTNDHVIEGASEITIILNDGTTYPAKVVGRDAKTDLAVLKIDADRPMSYVELGDSREARVGDWVLAVGNPFGLGGSVNAGIISARGRDINSGPYDDYLQIDAPINQGHSGGPLFDINGRVIGVNTAIYSPSGGNVGIGFAIPAETVQRVVADLRENGRVERGWLGVQIQPVTESLAAGLGLEQTGGVLIADVIPGSPASMADLRAGDVILSAAGHSLDGAKGLARAVAETKAGTAMTLRVLRDGQAREVSVRIARMPDDEQVAGLPSEPADAVARPRLGLYLAPLTPELRLEQGLRPDAEGVYVSQVESDSPAARAGIEAGSLISMVGVEPVTTPDQVIAAVLAAADDKVEALILRVEKDGPPLFVAVPLTT